MRKPSTRKRSLERKIAWFETASEYIRLTTALVQQLKALVLNAAELWSLLYLLHTLSLK